MASIATWSPYKPTPQTPWSLRRVVHLHRRPGFAATCEEALRDLNDGADASIDRLLNGTAYSTGVPDDFDAMSQVIGTAAVAANDANRLKAWWFYRMLFSADPLTERLTLMWHNHFATSNLKIRNVAAMKRQNEILRESARAPFAKLLSRAVKDPAILTWLDADSNRRQRPNENLARELMELFSIGIGNYTEHDVKEAARSLTGWTGKQGRFRFVEAYHDVGEKSFLGRNGKLDGDDVLQTVLNHPATSHRIAWRLCGHFFGEGVISDPMVDDLAAELRSRDLDIGWGVETILRSEAFFSDNNIGNRALGPIEYIVGAARALEMFEPPPSTLVLSEWSARLGQDLFYPPNVFGWPGGRDWLTTRSMVGRAAFGAELARGSVRYPSIPPDLENLRRSNLCGEGRNQMVDLIAGLLMPHASDDFSQRVIESTRGIKDANDHSILETILGSPEAQLG
jgi:uncharacterized protein (DUF1800 family)